jgi:hypothetical protein
MKGWNLCSTLFLLDIRGLCLVTGRVRLCLYGFLTATHSFGFACTVGYASYARNGLYQQLMRYGQ